MKAARVLDGVAVDVVDGDPAAIFTPDLAAQFEPVPDAVQPQWRRLPVIVDHQLSVDLDWFHPYAVVEAYEHELDAGPPPVTETRYRLVDRTPPPPAPPRPVAPTKVTARQAIQALISIGVYEEDVEAVIDGIADPTQQRVARNFWRRSNDFERANPTLNAIAPALGLTQAQLDDLFILAASL